MLGLASFSLFNVLVWKELQELKNTLTKLQGDMDKLRGLTLCPISESQAIKIVSEYTGWNMSYLEKYNTSAVLWYLKITNTTTFRSMEYISKVIDPVLDYTPKRLNENETLCYVWIVTVHDPELAYPIPHGVNWFVNAFNGEVIDIFLHH